MVRIDIRSSWLATGAVRFLHSVRAHSVRAHDSGDGITGPKLASARHSCCDVAHPTALARLAPTTFPA